MNTFPLKIVTPDGEIFSAEARSLIVRTDGGDVQIMKGHADYLASLATGRAKLELGDGEVKVAACSGGFLSVEGGEATLVATTFEFAEDIDVARAKIAKEKADLAIKAAENEKTLKLAKAKLSRAIARIDAASK